jgi:hypothetical protein
VIDHGLRRRVIEVSALVIAVVLLLPGSLALYLVAIAILLWLALSLVRRVPSWQLAVAAGAFVVGLPIGWLTLGKVLVERWVLVVGPGDGRYSDYEFARDASHVGGAFTIALIGAVCALLLPLGSAGDES